MKATSVPALFWMGLAGLNLWTTVAAQSTALLLLPDAPLGAICAAAVLASDTAATTYVASCLPDTKFPVSMPFTVTRSPSTVAGIYGLNDGTADFNVFYNCAILPPSLTCTITGTGARLSTTFTEPQSMTEFAVTIMPSASDVINRSPSVLTTTTATEAPVTVASTSTKASMSTGGITQTPTSGSAASVSGTTSATTTTKSSMGVRLGASTWVAGCLAMAVATFLG